MTANFRALRICALCSASIAGLATPALAQNAQTGDTSDQVTQTAEPDSSIEDIIVTATRRETDVQSTPLSITAVSGKSLAAREADDVNAIFHAIPNVRFGESLGMAQVAVRGVGFDNISAGGEGRVAYHVDGVYFSRPTSILGTLFDVNRVEVLRGPQGTLYGRNSTAGAINVITNDPTPEFGGYGLVTVGNYSLFKVEGALNVPLADGWSFRVAGQSIDRSGYGRNLTTGRRVSDADQEAARAKLRYRGDSVRLTVGADYVHEDDRAYGATFLGGAGLTAAGVPVVPAGIRLGGTVPTSSNPFDLAQNNDPTLYRKIYGFTGTGEFDLSDALTLTTITGYRRSRYLSGGDFDRTSANLAAIDVFERSRQFSQELRLSGDFGDLNVDLGGYYFHENTFGFTYVPLDRALIGQPSLYVGGYRAGGGIVTKASAVFFNADWNFTEKWTLTLGGRYSAERKSVDELYTLDFVTPFNPNSFPPIQRTNRDSEKWNNFTPKVTLSFEPNERAQLYATFATGFKSGGFNLGGLQAPFAPEKIDDIEAGFKVDWLDGQLRTNVSAFYYKYKDLQVSRVNANLVIIENAAKAEIKGIEAEIVAIPVENLTLTVNGSLLDSEYKTFSTGDSNRPGLGTINLSGNRLTQAPPYSFFAAAEYRWPLGVGDLSLRGEMTSRGRTYFSPFELEQVSQSGYSLYNAFLTLRQPEQGWTASLYIKNITDKTAFVSKFVSSPLSGSVVNGIPEAPRTFGATLRFDF